jgi:hypothetical protein
MIEATAVSFQTYYRRPGSLDPVIYEKLVQQ